MHLSSRNSKDDAFAKVEDTLLLPNTTLISIMDEKATQEQGSKNADYAGAAIFDEDISLEPVLFSVDASNAFREKLDSLEGHYALKKTIAMGGYGRVDIAEDQVLGRKVIVKTLKEDFLDREDIVRKFIAEAKLSAQLEHPSIVKVYGLDTDADKGLHLAMQLVKGVTLKIYLQRCRNQQLEKHYGHRIYRRSLHKRLEIFLHICDAIEYTHTRHVIHCDLKPENIMIGRFGEVYIMDWGIASTDGAVRKDNLSGTPAYMPPECLTDGITNQQTDVFALGMILNELVTLQYRVTGANPHAVAQRICNGDYVPSTCIDRRIRLPRTLRAIIEKAREAEPENRYATVHDLALDIRHYLIDEELMACPDNLFQHLMRLLFYRKRGFTILSIVTVMTLLVGITLFGFWKDWQKMERQNQQQLAAMQFNSDTRALCREFDKLILGTQEKLERMAMVLGNDCTDNEKTVTEPSWRLAGTFPKALPTQDAEKQGPFYKVSFFQYPISLDWGAAMIPADCTEQEIASWNSRLDRIRQLRLIEILQSMNNKSKYNQKRAENVQDYLKNGSLLRRITVIMNNGMVLRFPGLYENENAKSEFIHVSAQKKMDRFPRKIAWSTPYMDTSDHDVIACWKAIVDGDGRQLGVVGLELCYQNFMRLFFEQARKENFTTDYIVLDDLNMILFSTSALKDVFDKAHWDAGLSVSSMRHLYPNLDVLEKIRADNEEHLMKKNINGAENWVAWTKIPYVNWTILGVTPIDNQRD